MSIGELEYNYEDHIKERAGDERLAIRFFRKAVEMERVNGVPKFTEVDYINIMVPGDRTSAVVRPVSPGDKDRFSKQYEHYLKTQQSEMISGTPLEAWGILNLAQIEEFRYFGVRTIEQMAELRDDVCQKLMGATLLKQKAAKFVELTKEEAPLKKVQEELDKRDTQIAALTKAVEDQGKIIEGLRSKKAA
jgi:hypothetical protein